MKTLSLFGGCFLFLCSVCWSQATVTSSFSYAFSTRDYSQLSLSRPSQLSDFQKNIPRISAHRGGRFIVGYPENALETFQYIAKQVPLIIECDVNMSSDSILFLMHDQTLSRTSTGNGKVLETPWPVIRNLYLIDDYGIVTRYRPPALSTVLDWASYEFQLTLDIKRGVPISKVVEMVRETGALEYASVITYNYEDALEAYSTDPRILLSVNIRNTVELQRYLDGPFNNANLMAFTGITARTAAFYKKIKQAGIQVIVGTMGNLDKRAEKKGSRIYQDLHRSGADILATDRPVAAYKAFLD